LSRAFVKEDGPDGPEHRYNLPDPDSPYYAEAAAWALVEGADRGATSEAESATGYRWGEKALVPHVRRILERAELDGQDRVAQLARRFLRAAGAND
jgi:hypothetical protein